MDMGKEGLRNHQRREFHGHLEDKEKKEKNKGDKKKKKEKMKTEITEEIFIF
jgi:hypothetical protein